MLDNNTWLLDQDTQLISLNKWQKTVDIIARIFKTPAGFIVQKTDAGYQIVIASDHEANPYQPGDTIPINANIFCREVIRSKRPLYVADAKSDSTWDDNPELEDGFNSYLGVPILWPDGSPFGTVCVLDFSTSNYHQDYIELIEQLKDVIEDDLGFIDNFTKMRQIAMQDELTGIYNRRAFMILAEQKLKISKRMDAQCYVLFIDINDFKDINDNFGHHIGDNVLMAMADSFKECLVEEDIIGRLGGDEFVAALCLDARIKIEHKLLHIRTAFEQNLAAKALPSISLSIGYTLVAKDNYDIASLLSLADEHMYDEKNQAKKTYIKAQS